jgi:hypothetical protein
MCLSKILFTSLVDEGIGVVPLSLSNFFDSANIELKQQLSLSKKFDRVTMVASLTCRTISIDFIDCTDVELSVVGEGGGGDFASLIGELVRQ